jgi:predicted DNA-binding transcriptional regulator YafY
LQDLQEGARLLFMPANKNALIRYKTIDACLRNRFRSYTLNDLVEACSEALYDAEGIRKGVSMRTVQGDLQIMRSDKLGYNAPIEVYDHKYYRYGDPDYSIMNMPFSQNDYDVMTEAADMLRQLGDFDQFAEFADVIGRLQDKLSMAKHNRHPLIIFDSVANLKGLRYLNPLYKYIAHKRAINVKYKSFRMKDVAEFILSPLLLKEFRNRWFVFGINNETKKIQNLALDRIESLEPSDEIYVEDAEFNAERYFSDMIGVSRKIKDRPRKIRFVASEEQSKYIKTKPLHHTQKLISENEQDHSCIFEIKVIVNVEMYSVFMSYGEGVRIISPASVVASMQQKLRTMSEQYNNKD